MSDNSILTQARIDLTVALRWAARMGLNEGICNHFSLAVPGTHDRFLINPQGFHWSEITPDDLVLTDAEGNVIAGKHNVEATAFFIHGRIHLGKPNARCVLHTHMPYATALTSMDGGRLEWTTQNALRFYGRVAYDECYNGLVLDAEEGDRICAQLGNADVLFLANHGVNPWNGETVVDPSSAKRLSALMLTCGTYDAAGDFAYRVGLPAKSGVGGGIVAILPGECGICVWSPALEESGNSHAGSLALEMFTSLTRRSIF